jgi:hypothetical protein
MSPVVLAVLAVPFVSISCTSPEPTCGDCDDGNPCTDDVCRAGVCQHPPNSAPCDDGNPCTTGEACRDGSCQGGVNACQCAVDEDCAPHDDGDDCNGRLRCVERVCVPDPAGPVVCDTSQDPPCQRNTCQPQGGFCLRVPLQDGSPCEDGNACTRLTACAQGECRGQAVTCDDGNPCTDDRCLPAAGCDHPYNTAACDDGDACTQGDHCALGACGPGAESCCQDTLDNDGDGRTDCQDPGCAQDPACATYEVAWCRLHWPTALEELEGAQVLVFGRLHIPGVTTRGPGTDTDPKVLAQLGLGPAGSEPTQAGWSWQAAEPNPGWLDGEEPGNDEYQALLTVPAAAGSPYDFAYRFSADAGQSWTLCDKNAGPGSDGSEDGYQPAHAGKLQSRVDTGPPVAWCRLQWPTAVDQAEGSFIVAYGRVFIPGLTDQTDRTDHSDTVVAEAGHGPVGSRPEQGGWSWSRARPNTGWQDGEEPGNDEYQAELIVPPAAGSPYALAYRFSANGGQTWLVCDANAGPGSDGSEDGYQPEHAGAITARPAVADDSNWGFEQTWAASDPPGFTSTGDLTATRVTEPVSRGTGACLLRWTDSTDASLRLLKLVPAPAAGQVYSLHVWVRGDPLPGAVTPVLWLGWNWHIGDASDPSEDGFIHLVTRAEVGGSPLPAFVTGGLVAAYQVGVQGDSQVIVDDFDLTLGQPFQTDDGFLDAFPDTRPTAPYELASSPEALHVALNDDGELYLAGPRGIPGATDKMLFVWVGGADPEAPPVPLPWFKQGELAGPRERGLLFALVEEPETDYCVWLSWDAGRAAWEETVRPSACRGGAVLEGRLRPSGGLNPVTLPAALSVASIQVNTWDGGAMWSSHQTPACVACDDDLLTADETLTVHRASILVGRVP